jgi:hypothetical protein
VASILSSLSSGSGMARITLAIKRLVEQQRLPFMPLGAGLGTFVPVYIRSI